MNAPEKLQDKEPVLNFVRDVASDTDAFKSHTKVASALANVILGRRDLKALGLLGAWGRVTNRLFYGDNLDVLATKVADESVHLVYLDPPFNSKINYNVLYKSPVGGDAQKRAFKDTWTGGRRVQGVGRA